MVRVRIKAAFSIAFLLLGSLHSSAWASDSSCIADILFLEQIIEPKPLRPNGEPFFKDPQFKALQVDFIRGDDKQFTTKILFKNKLKVSIVYRDPRMERTLAGEVTGHIISVNESKGTFTVKDDVDGEINEIFPAQVKALAFATTPKDQILGLGVVIPEQALKQPLRADPAKVPQILSSLPGSIHNYEKSPAVKITSAADLELVKLHIEKNFRAAVGIHGKVKVSGTEYELGEQVGYTMQRPDRDIHASDSFITTDRTHFVKRYPKENEDLYLLEKQKVEEYKKLGIAVSEIVAFDDTTRTIVKRYYPGIDADQIGTVFFSKDGKPSTLSTELQNLLKAKREEFVKQITEANQRSSLEEYFPGTGLEATRPENMRFVFIGNEIRLVLIDP